MSKDIDEGSRARRRRRWPIVLLTLVALVSTGCLAMVLTTNGPGVGHFRTPAGRQTYTDAYRTAFAALPQPTETRDVETTFGTVRTYAWVNPRPVDEVPVVLVPGRASGVPMWGENLRDFLAHRTVYAFDAIGDSGLSEQTLPLRDMADNARWVEEALNALDLDRIHLVGHSQGGGLAAAVAVRHPERLASLTLLEPIMTFGMLPVWAIAWSAVAALPFLPESLRDHALNRIGGVEDSEVDPEDPMARMIAAGTRHFDSGNLPTPSRLTDEQMRNLKMPVYVAIASDKSLAGGEDAAKRAQRLPDATVKIWPETTHSLPMQVSAELDAELERFWAGVRRDD
ncbi:pimeloyl-ACP methyl ester carboxylesterase [Nocardioides luteus]|uniref:Carboxylesterase n=1 Tax=Nocardioides luteus TaxID=1844 RepID=A0ABQ5T195_9ACTN|nr:alpha/beta fold hydrolase [Nocardioides luteus]MDR7311591.1 pimeloyl-ACP methyl ester carboxylesterase [Nocardioides luteus]GGR54559.1 carboxylesterase [Nocardioides luteus]GLJ70240.1 carboxylesterase [Nocardioides luteus]